MQTKYKLSNGIKLTCLGLVRSYDERKLRYHARRADIIHSTGATLNSAPQGGAGVCSDIVYQKNLLLDELERSVDAQCLKAVDEAKCLIGNDIYDNSIRQQLRDAIIDCCNMGRKFTYEYNCVDGISSSEFYRRRAAFLYDIAVYLGFVGKNLGQCNE